jgi:hypothetical protein
MVYTGEHLNPDAQAAPYGAARGAPDTIDLPLTLPLNTNRTSFGL